MNLKQGSLLQGGKYKIDKVLGQGGFGITYLAEQVNLGRKVAIKEFFMKQFCDRNSITSEVTFGSQGGSEEAGRFKQKFIKEAQLISGLENQHIIRVHDIFEENGTAYYIMEYISGNSLDKYIKEYGAMSEIEAIEYIRQIAGALSYIHSRSMNHLDVKPSNILRRDDASVVLIDFGLSKRYDGDGNQTSSTPVGISAGYAPMEQYKRGGVTTFTPATDIYSLGATLYKCITGKTPPDANDILEDGLPEFSYNISKSVQQAIEDAMQPMRKKRPQSITAFIDLLEECKFQNLNTHIESEKTQPSDENSSETEREIYERETEITYIVCENPPINDKVYVIDGLYYKVISHNTVSLTYKNLDNNGSYISGDVIIPSQVNINNRIFNVISIENMAFLWCNKLTKVTMPNSITSIGSRAFEFCTKLSFINLPDSIVDIGDGAFACCTQLSKVSIPISVTTIGKNVFNKNNLKELEVSPLSPIYKLLEMEYKDKII